MTNIWEEIINSYLIEDPNISEIQTNGTSSLFVRKNGKRVEVPNIFTSEEDYNQSIYELILRINPNVELNKVKYLEEGKLKLPNGNTARVHIVLPPAADLPQVTIAKKTTSLTDIEKIYSSESISLRMMNFLKAAVDSNCTIVFSGSTGSGKTTFMEALTKLIPDNTRIGVVEDSPELSLIQPNVTYLHSHPWKPGMNPNNEVTLDWCTRQINRMRTDILLIGESRGPEFKQFITAANSGMEGSMTTLHANTPKLALQKMTQFIMEAQPQPVRTINKSIATTVDLIVQLSKTPDGRYKCLGIEEISEILSSDESAEIATTPLTVYIPESDNWTDTFLISDKLRKRLENKGYDCNNFTKKASRGFIPLRR